MALQLGDCRLCVVTSASNNSGLKEGVRRLGQLDQFPQLLNRILRLIAVSGGLEEALFCLFGERQLWINLNQIDVNRPHAFDAEGSVKDARSSSRASWLPLGVLSDEASR